VFLPTSVDGFVEGDATTDDGTEAGAPDMELDGRSDGKSASGAGDGDEAGRLEGYGKGERLNPDEGCIEGIALGATDTSSEG